MDEGPEFEKELRRALSMLGGPNDDAGVPESELVAVEKRLKRPIPEPLRAFYRLCGRHPAMGPTDALGLRIVDPSELELKKGAATFIRGKNGWDFAADFASPEKDAIIRGPTSEKDSHQSVSKALFGFAVAQVIVAMHNVFTARSFIKPTGFEALNPTLTREFHYDTKLGVLLRRELGEKFTIGAADSKVILELERRLETKLKPYRLDGKVVWKETPKVAPTKKAKPATDADYRAALATILEARHGRAVVPSKKPGAWLAKVEKKIGAKLPQPLLSFYAFVESDEDFFEVDRMLVSPEELGLVDSVLKLGEENQGVVQWGVKKKDLALPDPPVFEFGQSSLKKGKEVSPLSSFLVQTAAWQTVFGMEASAEMRAGSDEVDTVSAKLAPVFTNVGFSTPTQECHVALREKAIAIVVREPDGVLVYVGASQETLKSLEKKLGIELEWL